MRIARNAKRFGLLAATAFGLLASTHRSAQAVFTNQAASWFGGTAASLNVKSASLADIDGDGDLDVFYQGTQQRLYRNNVRGPGAHTLTFTDISDSMPLSDLNSTWSAAWGDYDGDRKVDVFIGQANGGSTFETTHGDVFKNNFPNFSNASSITGLSDPGFHQNVAWSDIDNDRDLDLLIGMEGRLSVPSQKHEIYLQGPAGHFTPVGAATGFQAPHGTKAYGMAIGDTDGDGDMDVYISTCQSGGNIRKNFFKNMLVETGSLGFIDIAGDSATDPEGNGTQTLDNGYGAEFIDFDDDGDLELFMVGADGENTKIWRNDGNNMFTDVDSITGHALLSDNGSDLNGGKAVDYDNDGDLDLFFHDDSALRGHNTARKLYRNDSDQNNPWKFTDVTVAQGVNNSNQSAYDSVWGDLDLDGDQDLIAPTTSGVSERVFINDAAENGNHWAYFRLAGATENTTAIGATLYATINEGTPDERTLRREANTNAGTFNQSDLPVHFGLGDADVIDKLEIRWPDGSMQVLTDLAVDRYLTIKAGDFNGDGVVNEVDIATWQADAGASGGGLEFLAWQRQYGFGAASASAIPEPATALLLAVAACVFASTRHRHAD